MSDTNSRRAKGTGGAADWDAGASVVGAAGSGADSGQYSVVSIQSPSVADGFGGARDAVILQASAGNTLGTPSVLYVRCTVRTKDLLHRAGFRRTRMLDSYPVRVMRDGLGRLQLAVVKTDRQECLSHVEGRAA